MLTWCIVFVSCEKCKSKDCFQSCNCNVNVLLYFMSKTTLFVVDYPEVTEHPKRQSVPSGRETIFKVEARGDDLMFQWQKNGRNLKNDRNYSGTDTNTLSIRHVMKSDEGFYRCLVMNEVKRDGILSIEAQLSVCKFKIMYKLGGYSFETMVYRSNDLVYTNLVRTEIPKVASNVVTAMFSYTDDRWKPLKVECGIFIIVVLIIAVIGMLWWLPGNGKQWLINLFNTLCLICHHIMLAPIDRQ